MGEPIGTNMDIDILHDMYKSGTPFEDLIVKGNTVKKKKKLFLVLKQL